MGRITSDTAPLVKIFLPLAAGIVCYPFLSWEWFMGVVLALGLLLIIFHRSSFLINIAILCFGYGITAVHEISTPYPDEDHYVDMIVRADESAAKRGRWSNAHATLVCFRDSTGVWHNSGRSVRLYADTSQTLHSGGVIAFRSKFYTGNPARVYASRFDSLTNEISFTESLRSNANRQFEGLHLSERDLGVLSALTLGDRSGMTPHITAGYSRAGVSHILAVSGQHVGILFGLLNGLVFCLGYWYRRRLAGSIVIIAAIWGYALLTGLSPSVCRAALMFTMWQGGIALGRGGNSLNALGAAAVIILIADPSSVYSLSFQMSFLALLGIIYFYQPVYGLWKVKNPVLRGLWSVTAIGIAAQICVMPLIAWCFGQVPMLGLVINPIVWITVPCIMLLAMIYLVFPVGAFGQPLAFVLDIQNDVTEWTASLPFAVIETEWFNQWWMIAVYVFIIFGIVVVEVNDGSLRIKK